MPMQTRYAKLMTDDEVGKVLRLREHRQGQVAKTDYYTITRNPAARAAFRLVKLTHLDENPTAYDILLAGEHSTCDCPGFLQWSHCKHVEGLTALQAAGKLESI